MSEALILPTDRADVTLRQLATLADDVAFFEAIEEDREHLSRHGNRIAVKYDTLGHVTSDRLQTVRGLRMGIWEDEDAFKGLISAHPNDDNTEVEIGLWLRSSATGQNYATLALRSLTQYLQPKFYRVFAETHVNNKESVRVLDRAGYLQTGEITRNWGRALVFEPLK